MSAGPDVRLLLATNVSASLLLLIVALSQSNLGSAFGGDSVAFRFAEHLMLWALAPASQGRLFGLQSYWWAAACCVFLWNLLMALKRKGPTPIRILFALWLTCAILALVLGTASGPAAFTALAAARETNSPTVGVWGILGLLGTALAPVFGAAVLLAFPAVASGWLALKCYLDRIHEAAK